MVIANDNTVAKETKVFQLFLLRTPDLDQRITIINSPPGILYLQDDDGIVTLLKMIYNSFLYSGLYRIQLFNLHSN